MTPTPVDTASGAAEPLAWRRQRRRELLTALVMLAPSLVFLAAFTYWPIARSLIYGFFDVQLGSTEIFYVGWENYQRLWHDALSAQLINASTQAALAGTAGLLLSYHFDTPSGPTIIGCAGALYFASLLIAPGGWLPRLWTTRHRVA